MKATQFEFRFPAHHRHGYLCPRLLGTVGRRLGAVVESDAALVVAGDRVAAYRDLFRERRCSVFAIQNAYLSITALAVVLRCCGCGSSHMGHGIIWAAASSPQRRCSGVEVMAAGPYRHVRNPLYFGSMLTALAVSILMPASGAVVFRGRVLFIRRVFGPGRGSLSASHNRRRLC